MLIVYLFWHMPFYKCFMQMVIEGLVMNTARENGPSEKWMKWIQRIENICGRSTGYIHLPCPHNFIKQEKISRV